MFVCSREREKNSPTDVGITVDLWVWGLAVYGKFLRDLQKVTKKCGAFASRLGYNIRRSIVPQKTPSKFRTERSLNPQEWRRDT